MGKEIKFGKMVEHFMRLNNMTMKELGKKFNRGESTVSMWISGKATPPMGIIQQMADFFGVTTDTMIYGDLDNDTVAKLDIEFNDYFPLHYSTNLSAGTLDELLDSEPDAIVYVPIKYQMRRKQLHAFKVNGTSMNNVIQDGSIVVVESVPSIHNLKEGTIVVAWVEGCATVKRLYIKDDQVTLMPDSLDKSHKPINIDTREKQVSIIGRVIWHMNPDDIDKTY